MKLKFLSTLALIFFYLINYAQIDYVAYHGQLSVNGTKIVNKYGDTVCFTGPSLFWSNTYWGGDKFYTASVVNWVNTDWEAPIIRASMGVDDSWGYIQDANNKTRIKTVVNAAIANGMYVIIDWHSHHAENYQSQAVAFFTEMAQTYGNYPNIIYEIYNEPLNVSWGSVIKPYAEAVIAAIRIEDPNNIIVVGSPNWSQDVDVASLSPITSYDDIAYSLHFYAGTHTQSLRDKAITAINNGLCLMVTEWGTVNANGDGAVAQASVDLWVDFMKEHKLTNCNWALNDKSEGASALVSGASVYGEWDASDLTESGTVVYDLIKYWDGNYVTLPEIKPSQIVEFYRDSQGNIVVNLNESSVNFSYKIIDLQGKIVSQSGIINSNVIEMSNLPKGVYILQIIVDSQIQTLKFVK